MPRLVRPATSLACLLALTCGASFAQKGQLISDAGDVKVVTLAEGLDHPWGVDVLPSGDLLVTERAGALRVLRLGDTTLSAPVAGAPAVFAEGQGGMLDVALDPDFASNRYVYLSYAVAKPGGQATTALGRGTWTGERLEGFRQLFEMSPALEGDKHFGARIVFAPDGTLFLTLAERFRFEPAQDLTSHLGTVVRLNRDGSVPADNPFVGRGDALPEIYSYGHRNIQAAAIHPATGELWAAEMGPMGGDELNRVLPGRNYGWPLVSWGQDYDGSDRPDPTTRPEFADAAMWWTPTISPSGMLFYTGDAFPAYRGTALIGGLTASGIVRVAVDGASAEEVERWPLVARIRDVEQAPDGTLYVLTDADEGKVLHLRGYR